MKRSSLHRFRDDKTTETNLERAKKKVKGMKSGQKKLKKFNNDSVPTKKPYISSESAIECADCNSSYDNLEFKRKGKRKIGASMSAKQKSKIRCLKECTTPEATGLHKNTSSSPRVSALKQDINSVTEPMEDSVTLDPYLLEDMVSSEKALKNELWTNKQRTLVFSSRGVTHSQRHLLDDLRKLMPHSKAEPKWEKKSQIAEINEIAESHSCNNCVFLETRKNTELYMWISKTPMGPSARFQVVNVHTLGELRMTGNCLLYSRPLIIFDKAFSTYSYLKLLKEMLVQAFGTPRNHPRSKPFFDHVLSFLYFDHKIWFRHYQISPMTERDANKPLRQCLTEIGPRFVLDPIKIFEDSFSGRVIFKNPNYLSPSKIRSLLVGSLSNKYAARKAKENDQKMRQAAMGVPEDFLDRKKIFSTEQLRATS